jgi:hypothetical protein
MNRKDFAILFIKEICRIMLIALITSLITSFVVISYMNIILDKSRPVPFKMFPNRIEQIKI